MHGLPRTYRRRHAHAQGEVKTASAAWLALNPDLAAHRLYQLQGNREPQTRASIFPRGRSVGLREGFKNPRLFRSRDSYAGVGYGKVEHHYIAFAALECRLHNNLAGSRELQRVAHQVIQHLTNANRVTH